MGQAGFRLRALGRLQEAVAPMRASLDVSRRAEALEGCRSCVAGNLSELQLTLGEVAEAIALAEQSVDYADRSGNALQALGQRARPGRCAASGGRADAGGSSCFRKRSGSRRSNSPNTRGSIRSRAINTAICCSTSAATPRSATGQSYAIEMGSGREPAARHRPRPPLARPGRASGLRGRPERRSRRG